MFTSKDILVKKILMTSFLKQEFAKFLTAMNHGNSCGKLLKQSSVYDMIIKKLIVLQGGLTFHFNRMGVMPMKKRKHKNSRKIKVSLMELLTFGGRK